MTAVIDRLGGDRPVFSVEFFPPRDDAGERQLWQAVRDFEPLDPAFASVTYETGGFQPRPHVADHWTDCAGDHRGRDGAPHRGEPLDS